MVEKIKKNYYIFFLFENNLRDRNSLILNDLFFYEFFLFIKKRIRKLLF
jgi:hypothetical protein